MKKKSPAIFKTRDLAEATTLLTLGKSLVCLERVEKNFLFCFDDEKSCEAISRDFWAGRLNVEPRAYSMSMRSLKDRIHIGR